MALPASSLDQLRRVKSEFLASLNHEMRTPLSGVLGMLDLLLETTLDAPQREYATAARSCAAELLGSLNEAIEFSAMPAGSFAPDEEEFNLAETLNGAARQHERKAREKGLRFAAVLDPALPQAALGDAVRLSEIVSHLVGNAVQFTSQGAVELRADAGPSRPGTFRLNVVVSDSGMGVAPEPRQSLFESLWQGQSVLAQRHAALSLGVALAEKLVAAMGGEFTLEAEAGKGSVASFWVPLRDSAEASGAAPAPAAGRRRVLVVEDDLISQRIISHHLSRLNSEAFVASSGEAAVEEASRGRYDVVLMDLQMPAMDGFETARRIREAPGYEGVPVIALTARVGGESRLSCLQRGMQGFLEKPLDVAKLAAAIEQALA
ncbi:MAG: response regulator [Bryobacteraceae bacterium]|jgi:CheY-like chemotaxis protein